MSIGFSVLNSATSVKLCDSKHAARFGRVRTTVNPLFKENTHQILPSEMSLPGIEVLIESCYPNIREIGEGEPSERRCKVAVIQRKCAVTSSVSVRLLYAMYN